MNERRPDPDEILSSIKKEEERAKKGRLKIFLGMAAGVGKTYAMLRAAARLRIDEGVNIIAGVIVSHGREETAELASIMPQIPLKKIPYRGTELEEMDLDEILRIRPSIVLVDELAHTNAPGSRHPKRYQDVLDILEAGIDVYSTMNIQHLESRAHTVGQITGIEVRETVPDSILDTADEVELIDLPPDELIKRLHEGKVYKGEEAIRALKNFFKAENLTALREMSLRLTAERVDHDLRDYMREKRIRGPWKTNERLLVAVSASPFSEDLIRWTRRTAYNLESPWTAVYVETSRKPNAEELERIGAHLALARELGAEVVKTIGENIPEEILRVAKEKNVTQIVVGKSESNIMYDTLRGGSVVRKLIHGSEDIDIHIVAGERRKKRKEWRIRRTNFTSNPLQYGTAILAVALVTLLNFFLVPFIGYGSSSLIFLLTVTLLALIMGRGPVFLAAMLSALCWNFFFIPPLYTFTIAKIEDGLMFVMYFAIAIVTGILTTRIRLRESSVRKNEEQIKSIYRFTKEISEAAGLDETVRVAVVEMGRIFRTDCAIILATNGSLAEAPHPAGHLAISAKEHAVALFSFEKKRSAGRFTDTLPMAENQYLPLKTAKGVVGVLGLRFAEEEKMEFDTKIRLETFSSQIASALEREIGNQKTEDIRIHSESERLYRNLLSSVSHELRTPIAAIKGAASALLVPAARMDPDTVGKLSDEIVSASDHLNLIVENLLDMSRIESGRVRLNLDWHDVTDLINVTVNRLRKYIGSREVVIDIEENLPLTKLDFVVMEQVLSNLLMNAAKYSPPGSRIRVAARTEGEEMLILVQDRGSGIPPDQINKIFDKFYRILGSPGGGAGLGLSICRGLVEAHGGTISAENRANGGARFIVRLPLVRS